MSDPNPSLIPSDDDYARLMKEESANAQRVTEELLKLAQKMDRVRFMIEMSLVNTGANPLPAPAMLVASGNLVDIIQAQCSRSDGKTDMVLAVQLCLVTAHRFADAAYRGYSRLADPMADKDEQIAI